MAAVGALVAAFGFSACGGGSSCPYFARLRSGDFSRTDTRLSWKLEVVEMPATLTFNQVGIPDFVVEYSWAVDLDSDRNGQTDLRLSISHTKQPRAEITTGDILSVTEKNLWIVDGPLASSTQSFDATLTGNTFGLEVDVTADPGLALVTERSQSTWTTFYMSGSGQNDQCRDSLR